MWSYDNIILMVKLSVIQEDITRLKVDAIVNAANSALLGGGGVDGAIHRAAGPGLLAECKTLGGCPVGEAKITSGYNLPAKFIIHTVGPVWHGGNSSESKLLANCYRNCLVIAEHLKIHTIAFPSISTGVYGYPKEKAAAVALEEIRKHSDMESLKEIIFVTFDRENYSIYSSMLKE
jgi:O-acetyl-ADP-ribose deacetylase